MFNPFKRLPIDPSKRFYKGFLRLSDPEVSRIYSQKTGDPEVKGIYGFDSVVRLNSTYLELVDRSYNWRGTWTLGGVLFFCLFFGLFCYSILGVGLGWGGVQFWHLVWNRFDLGHYIAGFFTYIPGDDIRGLFQYLLSNSF